MSLSLDPLLTLSSSLELLACFYTKLGWVEVEVGAWKCLLAPHTFLVFLGKTGARSVLWESLPPEALIPLGTRSLPPEILLSLFSFLRIFIPPGSLPSGLRGRRGLSASLTNKLLGGTSKERKWTERKADEIITKRKKVVGENGTLTLAQ